MTPGLSPFAFSRVQQVPRCPPQDWAIQVLRPLEQVLPPEGQGNLQFCSGRLPVGIPVNHLPLPVYVRRVFSCGRSIACARHLRRVEVHRAVLGRGGGLRPRVPDGGPGTVLLLRLALRLPPWRPSCSGPVHARETERGLYH